MLLFRCDYYQLFRSLARSLSGKTPTALVNHPRDTPMTVPIRDNYTMGSKIVVDMRILLCCVSLL